MLDNNSPSSRAASLRVHDSDHPYLVGNHQEIQSADDCVIASEIIE